MAARFATGGNPFGRDSMALLTTAAEGSDPDAPRWVCQTMPRGSWLVRCSIGFLRVITCDAPVRGMPELHRPIVPNGNFYFGQEAGYLPVPLQA